MVKNKKYQKIMQIYINKYIKIIRVKEVSPSPSIGVTSIGASAHLDGATNAAPSVNATVNATVNSASSAGSTLDSMIPDVTVSWQSSFSSG